MFRLKHSSAPSQPTTSTKFSLQIGTTLLCNHKTSVTFVNPRRLLRYEGFVCHGSLEPPLPYYEASSPSPSPTQEPASPNSPLSYLDSWKGWILGLLLSFILPIYGNRLGPLLKFKNEVETVVETADIAAEITVFVADKVEELAQDKIQQGGKFKVVATYIDIAAKETAKDAELAHHFLKKVKKVEKVVDSVIGEEEEDPIESALETAEQITGVAETVAEVVEKAAEEAADRLPDGGMLKGAVILAEKVAKDALLAEETIEKVEEVKEEVESVVHGEGKVEHMIKAFRRKHSR